MPPRRELLAFAAALALLVAALLADSLIGGKVLSPGDVVFAQESFRDLRGANYEPANRLLMDPVLQFQPWLEFNRAMLRSGRLPLWNSLAGCGAPHLANGQSAVFDPFHLIAYLGRLPEAHAWMASARLWVAGFGMYLLAWVWGFGAWGRWFAGLAFPFCGFLVVWLLFPVTNVAVWMPWMLWATERALSGPSSRRVGVLGLISGAVLLGGHIQTSAHVLIAAVVYAAWRWLGRRRAPLGSRWALPAWAAGVGLGIALASIEVVPLGCYLARSPVWSDRAAERPSPIRLTRPRVLDAACTALPYAFGSQRRGQPNLGKALGVHNLNESSGGFAGLATLIWLAPLGFGAHRTRSLARFLGGMVAVGGLAAFDVFPVANLLRALPVLDVMDHRRLALWVAFGLVMLGGLGLDRLHTTASGRTWGRWVGLWWVGAAGLVIAAGAVVLLGPRLREKALTHYAKAAAETPGADPAVYRARAVRQARAAVRFLPAYYLASAGHVAALALLALALRRGRIGGSASRGLILGSVLLDLFAFGRGLNPAIPIEDDRPVGEVIAYLRREVPPPARVLGIGAELPPNTCMRYGLADARNYDSVELARSLDWFAPLYDEEPGRPLRTSRRPITWAGVVRARDRLRLANVAAIVGPTPPPAGLFARVDRVGDVWIARLDPADGMVPRYGPGHGEIRIDALEDLGHRVVVPETFDPGWRAEVDGRAAAVRAHLGTFLEVDVPPGSRRLVLRYAPPEVRLATAVSLSALAALAAALTCPGAGRSARKKPPEAWKPRGGRVRIEFVTSSRCSLPAPTEGRDADGPLHV